MRLRLFFVIGFVLFMIAVIGIRTLLTRPEPSSISYSVRDLGGQKNLEPTRPVVLFEPYICSTLTPVASSVEASSAIPYTDDFCDSFLIEVEWPPKIEVGASEVIRISLFTASEDYQTRVEIANHKAIISTPDPDALKTLVTSASPGGIYRPYANIELDSVNFNIASGYPQAQLFNQKRIDWIWTISSDKHGLQWIDIRMTVNLRAIDNSNELPVIHFWGQSLPIDVYQPILTKGQISIMSLLSGLIGSGLSIPWLVEKFRQSKGSRKTIKKAKAK